MPDEAKADAVRAWGTVGRLPRGGSLGSIRHLALYVGILETLADEADRDNGAAGETMH